MIDTYHILLNNLQHTTALNYWSGVGAFIFAIAFLLVGLTRAVEFDGLELSPLRRRVMTLFHVVGCAVFACALALLGLDVQKRFDKITLALLLGGLILLFPIHIYAGILRRLELSRRSASQN